ncbi:MAG: N-acetylmuramoyl-L-alanine amidase [Chloroflexota bacterium]|nr:N-acetylmuramoyl-L-alanine amidase [Chloroflexota bacterium]
MGRAGIASLLIVACVVALACSSPAWVPLSARDRPLATPMAAGRGADAPEPPSPPPPNAAPAPERARPAPRAAAPAQTFPYTPHPEWIPTPYNHDVGRGGASIDYIIIHYTAISYARTIIAFNNPNSGVSAHYVIRGDGHIAQLVGESDTAWHAGNYWFNQHAVGIELELDPVTNPSFTDAQYKAAAVLTCAIAARHGIPLDRDHVIGHNEVPWPNDHTDPGPTWNWPHFMWLTTFCAPPTASTVHATYIGQSPSPVIAVGQTAAVTVTLRNAGSTAWRKGTPQEAHLGIRNNDTSFAFLADGWPTPDRPAVQNEPLVMPGGWATFTFRVKGTRPGVFTIPLRGVVDGGAWMDDMGMYVTVKVHPAAATHAPKGAAPASSR